MCKYLFQYRLIDLFCFYSQFEVRATDNRLGVSQTGVATMNVIVLRDVAPAFTNLPQTLVRDEADVQGTFVLQITAQDPNQRVSQICVCVCVYMCMRACVCVCVCVCLSLSLSLFRMRQLPVPPPHPPI